MSERIPLTPEMPRNKTGYTAIPESINATPESALWMFAKYVLSIVFGVAILFWVLTEGVAYMVPYLPPESEQWLTPIGEEYIKQQNKKHEIACDADYDAMLKDLKTHLPSPALVDMQIYKGLGDTINAYALPGGKIVLYDGLMRQLDDMDARRFVLAHEMGHVYHRHAIQALGKSVIYATLLMPAAIVFPQLSGSITSLLNVSSMQHSQAKELEADRYAVMLLKASNYDAHAGVKVFQLLEKGTKNVKTPEFLRTHPPDAARIAQIEALTGSHS
jgi:Zn-dependent protease with chaperone function